jgi:hypothetical protein
MEVVYMIQALAWRHLSWRRSRVDGQLYVAEVWSETAETSLVIDKKLRRRHARRERQLQRGAH